MKLIVGLGNHGDQYKNTRHNAGFLAVKWLANQWQSDTSWSQGKSQALEIKVQDKDIMLALPTTMMNASGLAVRGLLDFYKFDASNLLVIHDDADLELGQLKIVESTNTGAGHHGVLSVIEHVGPGFKRIRVGIGRPEQKVRDISNWVLNPLSSSDKDEIEHNFQENLINLLSLD